MTFSAVGLRVGACEPRTAARLVVQHHYLHRRPPISYAFALCREALIVGACTFGTPPTRHAQKSVSPVDPSLALELNRLWVRDEEPRNTESWFVSRCLRQLPARLVFSYADTAHGHDGYIYRALGWHYAGWTDMDRKTPKFDYVATTEDETLFGTEHREYHPREVSRSGHDGEMRRRKPKARYWTATGTRRERRRLEDGCGWPSLDWHELPVPSEHQRLATSPTAETPAPQPKLRRGTLRLQ